MAPNGPPNLPNIYKNIQTLGRNSLFLGPRLGCTPKEPDQGPYRVPVPSSLHDAGAPLSSSAEGCDESGRVALRKKNTWIEKPPAEKAERFMAASAQDLPPGHRDESISTNYKENTEREIHP